MEGQARWEHADSTANTTRAVETTATAAVPIAAGIQAPATSMLADKHATTTAPFGTETASKTSANESDTTSKGHATTAATEKTASVGETASGYSLRKSAAGRGDASAGDLTAVGATERGAPAVVRLETDLSGTASWKLPGATMNLPEKAWGKEKEHKERRSKSRCARYEDEHKYENFAESTGKHANSKTRFSRDSSLCTPFADEAVYEDDEELQLALALSASMPEAQKQDTADQRRKETALTAIIPTRNKASAHGVTGIASAAAAAAGKVYENNSAPSDTLGKDWQQQPQHSGIEAMFLTSSESSQSSSSSSSKTFAAAERPHVTIAEVEAEQSARGFYDKCTHSGTHMTPAATKSARAEEWFATDESNRIEALSSKQRVRQKRGEITQQQEQRLCTREVNERFDSIEGGDGVAAAETKISSLLTKGTQKKRRRERSQGGQYSFEYVEDEVTATADNKQRCCPQEMVINDRPAAAAASREQRKINMPRCARLREAFYAEKPQCGQQPLEAAADKEIPTGLASTPAYASVCTRMECTAAHEADPVIEAFGHREQLQRASPQASVDATIAAELPVEENVPATGENVRLNEVRKESAQTAPTSPEDGGRKTEEGNAAATAAQADGGTSATAEDVVEKPWAFERENSLELISAAAAGCRGIRSVGGSNAAIPATSTKRIREEEVEGAAVRPETLAAAERGESQIVAETGFRETFSVLAKAEPAVTLTATNLDMSACKGRRAASNTMQTAECVFEEVSHLQTKKRSMTRRSRDSERAAVVNEERERTSCTTSGLGKKSNSRHSSSVLQGSAKRKLTQERIFSERKRKRDGRVAGNGKDRKSKIGAAEKVEILCDSSKSSAASVPAEDEFTLVNSSDDEETQLQTAIALSLSTMQCASSHTSSSRSCENSHKLADSSGVSTKSANMCFTRTASSSSSSVGRSSSDTRSASSSGNCSRIKRSVSTVCDSLNSEYYSNLRLRNSSANVCKGRRNAGEGGGQVETRAAVERLENRARFTVPNDGFSAGLPFSQGSQSDVKTVAPTGEYSGSNVCSPIEEFLEGGTACVSVDTGDTSTELASAADIEEANPADVVAASVESHAEEATATAGETTKYMKSRQWAVDASAAGASMSGVSEESNIEWTDMDSDFEPEESNQSGSEDRRRRRRTQQRRLHLQKQQEWSKGEESTAEKSAAAKSKKGKRSREGETTSSLSPLLVGELVEASTDKSTESEEQASGDASRAKRRRGGTQQERENSRTRFAKDECDRRNQHIAGGDYTVSGRGRQRVRSTGAQHILSEQSRNGEGASKNWKRAESKAKAATVIQAGKSTKPGLTERRQLRAHKQQHRLRLRAELRLAENDAAVAAVTAWKRERLHEACIYVWTVLTQAIPSPIPSKKTSLGELALPAQNERQREEMIAKKAKNSTVAALLQRQQSEEQQLLLFTSRSAQQHNQQLAEQHGQQFAGSKSLHSVCSLPCGNLIEQKVHTSYTTPAKNSQSEVLHRPTLRTHMTLAQLDEAAATAGLADLNVEDLLKMIATAASIGAATADKNYAVARNSVQKSQMTEPRQGSRFRSRGGVFLSSKGCSSHYRLVLGMVNYLSFTLGKMGIKEALRAARSACVVARNEDFQSDLTDIISSILLKRIILNSHRHW